MKTKIDLHSHTRGSDGTGTPAAIAIAAKKAGLDALALTDHHTNCTEEVVAVAHALENVGILPLIGCEYSTEQGHLLIFGITVEKMQWGMYPEMQQVIDDVNNAGGACITPHPFKGYKKSLKKGLETINGLAAVEAFNGRTEDRYNDPARRIAEFRGIPTVSNSDAHRPGELGRCWNVFDGAIRDYATFLHALKTGQFEGHVTQEELEQRARQAERYKASAARYKPSKDRYQQATWWDAYGSDTLDDDWKAQIEYASDDAYNQDPEIARIISEFSDADDDEETDDWIYVDDETGEVYDENDVLIGYVDDDGNVVLPGSDDDV